MEKKYILRTDISKQYMGHTLYTQIKSYCSKLKEAPK